MKYKEYYDETGGMNPSLDEHSFNNIVYSAHFIFSQHMKGYVPQGHLHKLIDHLKETEDDNFLYEPKNSKDNLIAKCAVTYKLELGLFLKRMKLLPMILSSYLNPWDACFYIYCKSPKWLQTLIMPLILPVYFQMWWAIKKKHKVRPKLWERAWWILIKKPYELRYMQNDGKHLALLKAYALKDDFPLLTKWTKKIYQKRFNMLTGFEYVIYYNYFRDKNHPIIQEWKKAENRGLL